MLERDKLNAFWDVSKKELAEANAKLLNKDREVEELEEKQQMEIKVYKQKVKHLLYEYQNSIAGIQTTSEAALTNAAEAAYNASTLLSHDKRALKLELKEISLAHTDMLHSLQLKHDAEITKLRAEFDRKSKELFSKYERKVKYIREELDLRRKNEIHEIEERKNSQVNALTKNHEKAFAEMKNYYNDITTNNLALINSLKDQLEELKKNSERTEKQLSETLAENKSLSEPLTSAQSTVDSLRRQLANYAKDKTSLANSKARSKTLEEKNKELVWENEVLQQRFEQAVRERAELFEEFTDRVRDVKQKSGFKNLVLEQKLSNMSASLEKKDLVLSEVMNNMHLDPAAVQTVNYRMEEVMDNKNNLIKDLQWEADKAIKAHNNLIQIYEAKLREYAISPEELGVKDIIPSKNLEHYKPNTIDNTIESYQKVPSNLEVTTSKLEPEARPKPAPSPVVSTPKKLKAVKPPVESLYKAVSGDPATQADIPRVSSTKSAIEAKLQESAAVTEDANNVRPTSRPKSQVRIQETTVE